MRLARWPLGLGLPILLAFCGVCTHAQVLRQLTNVRTEDFLGIAIDDAGSFVVSTSSEDAGSNPLNEIRLVGWDLPGGSRFEILPYSVALGGVSVSDDGQWIAFVSPGNLLGQNPDGSFEIFLTSADGSMVRQMTERPLGGGTPRPLLAGSANRLLYLDNADPLGANPLSAWQLFLVEFDGTGLTQLTSVDSTGPQIGFCDFSVSDDGERIVFAHNENLTGDNPHGSCQLYRVDPDGNNLTQLTQGEDWSGWPVLAGDGSRLSYTVRNAVDYTNRVVHVRDWDGASSTPLTDGLSAGITDDGTWVYFENLDASETYQLFKIPAAGGAPIQLTVAPTGSYLAEVAVSGAGSRVAFRSSGGEYPGGHNPDGSRELIVLDSDGTGARQLTEIDPLQGDSGEFHWEPDITPDGRWVVFGGGRLEGSAIFDFDIYRLASDGSESIRLTTDADAYYPSIAGDGQTVTFVSARDLLGLNGCTPWYKIYSVQVDSLELDQLTNPSCASEIYPVLAKQSDRVVFQGPSGGLLYVTLDGTGSVPIYDDGASIRKNPRVDYAGEWVVYHSTADPFGSNPDGLWQVFRIRTDGTGLQQLSGWDAFLPDLSADGELVVYGTVGDPLGLNPDGNQEILLYRASTGNTEQLTITDSGYNKEPRISGNGRFVYFVSTSPFFESVADGREHLYRVEIDTGRIERADGIPDPRAGVFSTGTLRYNPAVAVDESGDRVVFTGKLNGARTNGDLSREVFVADFSAMPEFEISATSPTLLRWDPDPRGVRYDVLRGDLANLRPGAGGTVQLGPVVCLENDSLDTTTLGFEDPDEPAPGHGFFFLYRWTQGTLDGPGSWGQGSGGAERVVDDSCAP